MLLPKCDGTRLWRTIGGVGSVLLALGWSLGTFVSHAQEIDDLPVELTEVAVSNESEQLKRGAALVEARVCRVCHWIGDEGAWVGPALDQVTLRRSNDWLKAWLKEPSAIKSGTLMPEFPWTDDELDAVIAYLAQYRRPVDGDAILTEAGYGPSGGQALIEAYQCWACHKVLDQTGRPIYPDLLTVQERRTMEWEKRWLKSPQSVKPGTFMPTFGLSEAEIDAITVYLYQSSLSSNYAVR